MARKKIKVNKKSGRRQMERRSPEYDNYFWLKVKNGFKKFLESPIKK